MTIVIDFDRSIDPHGECHFPRCAVLVDHQGCLLHWAKGSFDAGEVDEGVGPRLLPAKTLLTIHTGTVLRHELAGAGGWGDPLDRDPDRVLADVLNEKVSITHARDAYAVVLNTDATAVDVEATTHLRAERRRQKPES